MNGEHHTNTFQYMQKDVNAAQLAKPYSHVRLAKCEYVCFAREIGSDPHRLAV